MRPTLNYKKVSKKRLQTLKPTAELSPFLQKVRKMHEQRERERLRYAKLEWQTARHGRSVEAKYRMKPGEYAAMLERQNYSCITCNRHETDFPRRMHVDHNHLTGKVRGLLCINCNNALGHVRENIQTLRNLAFYLEFHTTKG